MVIYLILGLIIGLLLAIIVFLGTKRYQTPIERTLKQAENRLKEKGEIYIESENDKEIEALLESLPQE